MAIEGTPLQRLSPVERIQKEGAFCPLDVIHLYQRTSQIMELFQLEPIEVIILPERELDKSSGKTLQKVQIHSPEDPTLDSFFQILDAGLEKYKEMEFSRDEMTDKKRRNLVKEAMSNAAEEISERKKQE